MIERKRARLRRRKPPLMAKPGDDLAVAAEVMSELFRSALLRPGAGLERR